MFLFSFAASESPCMAVATPMFSPVVARRRHLRHSAAMLARKPLSLSLSCGPAAEKLPKMVPLQPPWVSPVTASAVEPADVSLVSCHSLSPARPLADSRSRSLARSLARQAARLFARPPARTPARLPARRPARSLARSLVRLAAWLAGSPLARLLARPARPAARPLVVPLGLACCSCLSVAHAQGDLVRLPACETARLDSRCVQGRLLP